MHNNKIRFEHIGKEWRTTSKTYDAAVIDALTLSAVHEVCIPRSR